MLTSLTTAIRRVLHDRADGATAIEYALLASFIAMAIIATVATIAPALAAIFGDVEAGFPG